MARPLLLLLILCSACQNTSQVANLVESHVFSSIEGEVFRREQTKMLYTANSLEMQSYNSKGEIQDIWYSEKQGNTVLTYLNNKLYSASTYDPGTGCNKERYFTNKFLSEVTKCADRLTHAVEVKKQKTLETVCTLKGNQDTCITTEDGKTKQEENQIVNGNSIINVDKSFVLNGFHIYHLETQHILSNGKKSEFFTMELPEGSLAPQVSDPRWKSCRVEEMTDYLPEYGLYSLIKEIDFDEGTSSTRTIKIN
jgi:hypothetical protein